MRVLIAAIGRLRDAPSRALFDSYAETLGLDMHQFRKDVKSDKVRERIESDQARAKSLRV